MKRNLWTLLFSKNSLFSYEFSLLALNESNLKEKPKEKLIFKKFQFYVVYGQPLFQKLPKITFLTSITEI
jgi:hypothetical protein